MTVTINDIQQAAARLQGVAVRTPLLNYPLLDDMLQARVFLKAENLQHIGAFKFRGAYNRLVQLNNSERARGVVAFSSGNHAQGVAYAARLLDIPATIVMPTDAPKIKLEGTKRHGAKVREYDRATESREDIAAQIAQDTGAVLVPAFDDPHIIAGQGTCGLEVCEQLASQLQKLQSAQQSRQQESLQRKSPKKESLQQESPQQGSNPLTLDFALAPCGGGGLMAGFSTAIKSHYPDCQILGVEPEHYDDHYQSWKAGRRTRINPSQATRCDALMATIPGQLTWPINSKNVSGYLTVSEQEILHAISFAAQYLKLTIEPGGSVALAALLAGKLPTQSKTIALILSGGNITPTLLQHCLQLPLPKVVY